MRTDAESRWFPGAEAFVFVDAVLRKTGSFALAESGVDSDERGLLGIVVRLVPW
jgi:hypothetical protein